LSIVAGIHVPFIAVGKFVELDDNVGLDEFAQNGAIEANVGVTFGVMVTFAFALKLEQPVKVSVIITE